jgi:hypothetical protein
MTPVLVSASHGDVILTGVSSVLRLPEIALESPHEIRSIDAGVGTEWSAILDWTENGRAADLLALGGPNGCLTTGGSM